MNGLSEEERLALLRAWPWPQEAATTKDGFGDVVAAVERILAARVASAAADAWDEGYSHCFTFTEGVVSLDDNPYRAALSVPTEAEGTS